MICGSERHLRSLDDNSSYYERLLVKSALEDDLARLNFKVLEGRLSLRLRNWSWSLYDRREARPANWAQGVTLTPIKTDNSTETHLPIRLAPGLPFRRMGPGPVICPRFVRCGPRSTR
jgi:hypothetical protein